MQIEAAKRRQSEAGVATPADFEACRLLHRKHGTTYYFATQRLPKHLRDRVHALYGFVRVPDEWVDNPAGLSLEERANKLRDYRSEFLRGVDGVCPSLPELRAFCDVAHQTELPIEEPLSFLDAMEMDLSVERYATYEELKGYMRGSASAVGLMMCAACGVPLEGTMRKEAMALGEAMQLTNFLRDVGEDLERGRIYLPFEDLESFGVTEAQILERRLNPCFINLMKFEIERARALYRIADAGIPKLPPEIRPGVKLARILYARILDRIEARGYDVFSGRARTSTLEKLTVALRVMAGLQA